jgi:hypothetical protein
MNIDEELKNKLTEYLVSLESGLKSAKDFSTEQVPLVVQEYLNWIFWSNLALLLLFITIFSFMVFVINQIRKRVSDDNATDCYFVMFFIGLFSLFPLLGLMECGAKAMKVKIAPRIVIIEKVADLVKENK